MIVFKLYILLFITPNYILGSTIARGMESPERSQKMKSSEWNIFCSVSVEFWLKFAILKMIPMNCITKIQPFIIIVHQIWNMSRDIPNALRILVYRRIEFSSLEMWNIEYVNYFPWFNCLERRWIVYPIEDIQDWWEDPFLIVRCVGTWSNIEGIWRNQCRTRNESFIQSVNK